MIDCVALHITSNQKLWEPHPSHNAVFKSTLFCLSAHLVPTFISFLQEVESPYEIHEYVKTYLGDSPESSEFARKFLERRARHKEHQRKQTEQMVRWKLEVCFLLLKLVS